MPFHRPSDSKVVQFVYSSSTTTASTTNRIPIDDTLPQSGEGDEFITVTITPKNASNILHITMLGVSAASTVGGVVVALFQDSGANALVAVLTTGGSTNGCASLEHIMTAGTTSATTFKIRYGRSGASGTATFNGFGGAGNFGTGDIVYLSVTEYLP